MKTKLAAIVILAMWIVSCAASKEDSALSFREMSTRQKAAFLMSMYNKQYDEYIILYERSDGSEETKALLRQKKKLLEDVYPMINLYVGYADEGVIPPEIVEKRAIELMYDLLGYTEGGPNG